MSMARPKARPAPSCSRALRRWRRVKNRSRPIRASSSASVLSIARRLIRWTYGSSTNMAAMSSPALRLCSLCPKKHEQPSRGRGKADVEPAYRVDPDDRVGDPSPHQLQVDALDQEVERRVPEEDAIVREQTMSKRQLSPDQEISGLVGQDVRGGAQTVPVQDQREERHCEGGDRQAPLAQEGSSPRGGHHHRIRRRARQARSRHPRRAPPG